MYTPNASMSNFPLSFVGGITYACQQWTLSSHSSACPRLFWVSLEPWLVSVIPFHTDVPSPIFWRRYLCMKKVCFWARVTYSTVLSRTAAEPRALLCNELRKGTFFCSDGREKLFQRGSPREQKWSPGRCPAQLQHTVTQWICAKASPSHLAPSHGAAVRVGHQRRHLSYHWKILHYICGKESWVEQSDLCGAALRIVTVSAQGFRML